MYVNKTGQHCRSPEGKYLCVSLGLIDSDDAFVFDKDRTIFDDPVGQHDFGVAEQKFTWRLVHGHMIVKNAGCDTPAANLPLINMLSRSNGPNNQPGMRAGKGKNKVGRAG